jgi:hypothetical protein
MLNQRREKVMSRLIDGECISAGNIPDADIRLRRLPGREQFFDLFKQVRGKIRRDKVFAAAKNR